MEKIEIAYDIDGIFIPDFNNINTNETTIDDYLKHRSSFLPLFSPKQKWIAISGRPIQDTLETVKFLNMMENPPKMVILNNMFGTLYAEEHKATVINNFQIKLFIESDLKQANYIREKCAHCKVIHFSSFISDTLNTITDNY